MKAYNSSRHIHSREPRVVKAETIPISYDIHVLRLCSRIKAVDPTQSRISISLQLPPTTLHTQIAFRTRNTWGWYSSSDARFSNSRDSAETRYGEKKGESIFPQMGREHLFVVVVSIWYERSGRIACQRGHSCMERCGREMRAREEVMLYSWCKHDKLNFCNVSE